MEKSTRPSYNKFLWHQDNWLQDFLSFKVTHNLHKNFSI